MSVTTDSQKTTGWFGGLVDGAARALTFGAAGTTRPPVSLRASEKPNREKATSESGKKPARKLKVSGLTLQVRRLAADGLASAEIARRTALSQDTVALLLYLAPDAPVESAGRGSFFRARTGGREAGR